MAWRLPHLQLGYLCTRPLPMTRIQLWREQSTGHEPDEHDVLLRLLIRLIWSRPPRCRHVSSDKCDVNPSLILQCYSAATKNLKIEIKKVEVRCYLPCTTQMRKKRTLQYIYIYKLDLVLASKCMYTINAALFKIFLQICPDKEMSKLKQFL